MTDPQDPLKRIYGREFGPGEMIFREGDLGHTFYLIQQGHVRIVKGHGESKAVTLVTLGPGDFFGEMALFELEPRSATALADEPTTLFELTQKNFENFILSKPRIALTIIQTLCQRLRRTSERLSEVQSQLASASQAGGNAGPAASAASAASAVAAASGSVSHPFDRPLAARLLVALALEVGQVHADTVVIRPRIDIGVLSRRYNMDLGSLTPLLDALAHARYASDIFAGAETDSLDRYPILEDVLGHTILGLEIVDLRKTGA